MDIIINTYFLFFSSLCLSTIALADPPSSDQLSEEQGLIPPQLIEELIPEFPEDADPSEHGDVTVRVYVNAKGKVTFAEVLDGPVEFRESALVTAYKLQFEAATLNGVPFSASTVIELHFAPPEDSFDDSYEEVVVHSNDPDRSDTHSRTTIDEATLDESASQDLADTLSQVSGVVSASGTADTSKPIIRGQPERRVLTLNDGVRHEGQKWGSDHATEIDPFSAGSISVIRGAAGVRYGPDAIGGVILVEPPPMRTRPGVGGKVLASFASNGVQGYGATRLDFAPAHVPGLSFRVEGSYRRGSTIRTPEYWLGNTASEIWNVGAAVQYTRSQNTFRLTYHHYDLRAGVFYGMTNSSPTEFEERLEFDIPPGAERWKREYIIDRPYQKVSHDQIAAHWDGELGSWGSIHTTYAYQHNNRKEFDQVRSSIDGAQYNFILRTNTLDVTVKHNEQNLGKSAWLSGEVGIHGITQDNLYDGLTLIPDYRSYGVSAFFLERLSLPRFDLVLGGRYDHLSRTAFLTRTAFEQLKRETDLTDDDCNALDDGGAECLTGYNTGSVTLGGLFHVVPEVFDWKVDLSSATRFPNVDEVYIRGTAPTFPIYAIGDPLLGVETTWGASTTLGLSTPWFEGEASAYFNAIQNYIYFAPVLNDAGDPRFKVIIRGTFPLYGYRPINANFYGTDATLRIAPKEVFGVNVTGSLVRAYDTETNQFLVGIPPDRMRVTAVGRVPPKGALRQLDFVVSTDLVAEQSRVDPSIDFAPPPPGYALLGFAINSKFMIRDLPWTLGVEMTNVLNSRYRDYLSLLRFYADEPGFNARIRLGLNF